MNHNISINGVTICTQLADIRILEPIYPFPHQVKIDDLIFVSESSSFIKDKGKSSVRRVYEKFFADKKAAIGK